MWTSDVVSAPRWWQPLTTQVAERRRSGSESIVSFTRKNRGEGRSKRRYASVIWRTRKRWNEWRSDAGKAGTRSPLILANPSLSTIIMRWRKTTRRVTSNGTTTRHCIAVGGGEGGRVGNNGQMNHDFVNLIRWSVPCACNEWWDELNSNYILSRKRRIKYRCDDRGSQSMAACLQWQPNLSRLQFVVSFRHLCPCAFTGVSALHNVYGPFISRYR